MTLQEHPGQKYILTNFEHVADYGWVHKTPHTGVYRINSETFSTKAKGVKVKLRTTIWQSVHYVVTLQKLGSAIADETSDFEGTRIVGTYQAYCRFANKYSDKKLKALISFEDIERIKNELARIALESVHGDKTKIKIIFPGELPEELQLWKGGVLLFSCGGVRSHGGIKVYSDPVSPIVVNGLMGRLSLSADSRGVIIGEKNTYVIGIDFSLPDTTSIPHSQKVDRKDELPISEIEKLTNVRDAEALISNFLKNRDWETQRRATEALCKIGKEAVDPLILTLRDEDKFVREHAAGALGKIKDTRAIGPLITALKDENVEVQLKAAEALETITGKSFGTDIAKWNEWWERNKSK